MASALCVLTQPEAEVEYQLDHVGYLTGFGVVGDCRCGHNGVDNAKGGGIFSFERRVLNAVGFNMTGEATAQSSVSLGVWRLSCFREAIQEVDRRNCPPFLRNRLFPKSVQVSLGVLGMSEPVSVYLKDLNSREG